LFRLHLRLPLYQPEIVEDIPPSFSVDNPVHSLHEMKNQTPCSDYVETSGIIFFARMLDKIRLRARGVLADSYNLGFSDPTSFDARFCRFWHISTIALH
jgi:Domain of unknown function (DUF5069)